MPIASSPMPAGIHRTPNMIHLIMAASLRAPGRAHIEKHPSNGARGLTAVLCFLTFFAVSHTPVPAGRITEAREITAGSGGLAVDSCAARISSNSHWWGGFGPDGLDGRVEALVVHDGGLVAGGWFSDAGGKPANRLACWDGREWRSLGDGIEGTVYALGVHGGDLFAGGSFFSYPNGDSITDVAMWDGLSWKPVGDSLGFNPHVFALAVYEDGLIAAGGFNRVSNGDTIKNIARLNGTRWEPMKWTMRGMIRDLIVYEGNLIAGGRFTETEDDSLGNIAYWDGNSWTLLGGGTDDPVDALTIYNGNLIAGGDFHEAGGNRVSGVALWDGETWSPLGQGIWGNVWSLCVYDSNLVAGGFFEYAGGTVVNDIARWDGREWSSLGSGMEWVPRHVGVFAVTPYQGSLYAGGAFLTAGNKPSNRIARWDDVSPELEISVFQNPYLKQYLDIYVIASEYLDSATVEISLGGMLSPARCIDSVGKAWLVDHRIGVESDSLEVAVCAFDIVGNRGCSTRILFADDLNSENPGTDQVALEHSICAGAAYPNPCNTVTTIPLDITLSQHVRATVYDALGRQVVRILDGYLEAGAVAVKWNGCSEPGRRCAEGLYFIRFETTTQLITRRVMLVR